MRALWEGTSLEGIFILPQLPITPGRVAEKNAIAAQP